jgi:RNA-directed DNA polymerase
MISAAGDVFDSEIKLEELFKAYFDCRKNKRNTTNALAFEIDYESKLIELCYEINSGTYQPGKSIAFIVNQPVRREIFAADFRDRIIHHLIINKLNPLFEKDFIGDSYSSRLGRGTGAGVKRLDGFIRRCSKNYSQGCYVLKVDIAGFFMHIDKNILFEKLKDFIEQKYLGADKLLVLNLCKRLIDSDPTRNCIIKGSTRDWDDLPNNKSLFHSPHNCGLPIGNLTSQIFANFYLNVFDHFIKNKLAIRFYGRYVDDCVLVHQSKEYLEYLTVKLRNFLRLELKLELHPKKIYLQYYTKGVEFLGVVIKPNRMYISNRTKGNFYAAIMKQNDVVDSGSPIKEEKDAFLCSMNSYLGIMRQYKSYNIRKDMIVKYLSHWWWDHVYLGANVTKFIMRPRRRDAESKSLRSRWEKVSFEDIISWL